MICNTEYVPISIFHVVTSNREFNRKILISLKKVFVGSLEIIVLINYLITFVIKKFLPIIES